MIYQVLVNNMLIMTIMQTVIAFTISGFYKKILSEDKSLNNDFINWIIICGDFERSIQIAIIIVRNARACNTNIEFPNICSEIIIKDMNLSVINFHSFKYFCIEYNCIKTAF